MKEKPKFCETCGAPVYIYPKSGIPSRWCLPCKKKRHVEQHVRWLRNKALEKPVELYSGALLDEKIQKALSKLNCEKRRCDICGHNMPVVGMVCKNEIYICRRCRIRKPIEIQPMNTFDDYDCDYYRKIRLRYWAERWHTAEMIAVEYGFKIERVNTDIMDKLLKERFIFKGLSL